MISIVGLSVNHKDKDKIINVHFTDNNNIIQTRKIILNRNDYISPDDIKIILAANLNIGEYDIIIKEHLDLSILDDRKQKTWAKEIRLNGLE